MINAMLEKASSLIERYKVLFGLQDWRIRITLSKNIDGDTYAKVAASFERQLADIEINPATFTSEDELEAVIRHELFHLITSPILLLLDRKVDADLYHFVNEAVVRGIERMFDTVTEVLHAGDQSAE